MTTVVTGGAGFIGSHLTESLLASGEEVIILDDLSTGSEDNLAAVLEHPSLEFV
jgi:UDP-glucose 4-epimerase